MGQWQSKDVFSWPPTNHVNLRCFILRTGVQMLPHTTVVQYLLAPEIGLDFSGCELHFFAGEHT